MKDSLWLLHSFTLHSFICSDTNTYLVPIYISVVFYFMNPFIQNLFILNPYGGPSTAFGTRCTGHIVHNTKNVQSG